MKAKRDYETDRTLKDQRFINAPSEWPRWPILPVKSKIKSHHDDGFLGVMIAEERPPYRVYLNVNIFEPADSLGKLIEGKPVKEYPTVEALTAEWWVD